MTLTKNGNHKRVIKRVSRNSKSKSTKKKVEKSSNINKIIVSFIATVSIIILFPIWVGYLTLILFLGYIFGYLSDR